MPKAGLGFFIGGHSLVFSLILFPVLLLLGLALAYQVEDCAISGNCGNAERYFLFKSLVISLDG